MFLKPNIFCKLGFQLHGISNFENEKVLYFYGFTSHMCKRVNEIITTPLCGSNIEDDRIFLSLAYLEQEQPSYVSCRLRGNEMARQEMPCVDSELILKFCTTRVACRHHFRQGH